MLFAAIDMGSNAVRLYFANVFLKNKEVVVEKASLIRIPVRLGEDAFSIGYISDEKRKNLIQTVTAFKMLIDVYKPLSYKACATSAMREASNNIEIVNEIKEKTGVDVQIIDGIEEARILCETRSVELEDKYKYALYIDVGGGSTEISVVKDNVLIDSNSFRIGTIRMLCHKDEEIEWIKMKTWLNRYEADFNTFYCVGSGGNINKLEKIYGNYEEKTLSYKNLERGYNNIIETSMADRIKVMGMRPDRADVIEPAAKIFLTIMDTIKAQAIFVPKVGLADGLIHQLYYEYINTIDNGELKIDNCKNLNSGG